ncbi:MAG TPA: hypothetical protein VGM06_17635 [Polyangiaceae bacterium]
MNITHQAELIAKRARRIARAVTTEARVWLGSSQEAPENLEMPEDEADDDVAIASRDSFPASDPPAWIGMRVGSCSGAPPDDERRS